MSVSSTEHKKWYGSEKQNVRCKHIDCIYRNTTIANDSRCNYMFITGKTRTVDLQGKEKLPCNCPKYVSSKCNRTEGVKRPVPVFREHLPRKAKSAPAWYKQAAAMVSEGKTIKEIANEVSRSTTVVAQALRNMGLQYNKAKQPISFDTEKAYKLWQTGAYDTTIAKECGCSVTAINKWRIRENLAANYKRRSE